MKISTKGRYALRLMMEFARQPEQVTRLKDAAAKQELSEKYLEQIVAVLSKAGFVKSIRGAQGGYLLTRAPNDRGQYGTCGLSRTGFRRLRSRGALRVPLRLFAH